MRPELIARGRVIAQGTLDCARFAFRDGVALNIAGGTHHAFADRGEGFCVFNDIAIAANELLQHGEAARILVVDLDVHQGNGNAAYFSGARAWPDGGVFTFSMHGARNFPFRKPPSTRDVALPDGTEDAAYLETLARHLPEILDLARPDVVVYLGGVDVVADDRYGRLSLSRDGLAARDRYVCETVRKAGTPLCLLLSGGYAARRSPGQAPTTLPTSTADLHATMYREAASVYR